MRGLAFRRHQMRRSKARALRYLRWLWTDAPQWITPRAIGRRAIDRTPCSCWMCGNPRRYHGKITRQELLAWTVGSSPDLVES